MDIMYAENGLRMTTTFTRNVATIQHKNEKFSKFSPIAPHASAKQNAFRETEAFGGSFPS